MEAKHAPEGHAPERHALVAGGGTGGHVFPALAVAHELERRGWSVGLAGSGRGLEARLASEHRVDFHALPARPILGKGRLAQLRALGTLLRSAWAARGLVRRLGSRVVLGTGGYASAPAVVGARLAGRPVLLLEPNAASGAANRWLSRLAKEALVAFEETRSEMACPSRVTGVPIREEFFRVEPLPEDRAERPNILVLGGSQGARQLNELLPAAFRALAAAPGGPPALRVVHQCGAAHAADARQAYEAAELGEGYEVEVTPFIDDVAAAMERADLLVCRAGALTTAEIMAAGRPALFIPLGIAAGHQGHNARVLVDAEAARMLPSKEATVEALAALLTELLADRGELARMGRRARELARPDAVREIADRLEAAARPGDRR